MPWLPVLFIAIPFTELMILLEVGAAWGVAPTLALIISTALIGYTLFKQQGIKTWLLVQSKLNTGELPSREMAEGIVILVAGALMITPGLITDAVGLFCLIPFTRKLVLTSVIKHFKKELQCIPRPTARVIKATLHKSLILPKVPLEPSTATTRGTIVKKIEFLALSGVEC